MKETSQAETGVIRGGVGRSGQTTSYNVDLADLRAFISVAELGAFHEAAEQLNLSQSALTRRVQKLEEALDVALLQRTTRRVELTTV